MAKSVLAAAAAALSILSALADASKSDDGLVIDISADRPECLYKLGEETTFTASAAAMRWTRRPRTR